MSWSARSSSSTTRRRQEAENPVAGLLAEGEAMPTADELAAQFERFLAENQGRTDPPGSQGSPDH